MFVWGWHVWHKGRVWDGVNTVNVKSFLWVGYVLFLFFLCVDRFRVYFLVFILFVFSMFCFAACVGRRERFFLYVSIGRV